MALTAQPTSLTNVRNKATIFQWNACSLRCRLSDFRQSVRNHRFPVITISESRVRTGIRLSGYTITYSSTGGDTSRVLLAIRNDLIFNIHAIPPDASNEYTLATVKWNSLTFTVIAAYIPPGVNFDVNKLQAILDTTPEPHVLTGDFNAHHPAWGGTRAIKRGRCLLDLAHKNDLVVLNNGQPTFFKGNRSSALDISLVSSSFASMATWFPDVESYGSDHIPTYIALVPMQNSKARTLRCTDWEIYRATLEHSDTSDMAYEEFIGALSQTKRSSTKYLKLPGKRTTVDIGYERLRAMRRRSERRARKTLSSEDIREARRMQRHVQRHLDKLGRRQWCAFCSKLDPRKPLSRIWSIAQTENPASSNTAFQLCRTVP
ncbi:hypothetical protein HPB50_015408 [Hyalomma asiaticum]|uniref:Uncharacterized protein n=1 Tax=Hyalomma asiaticum TaxID=266040 RepID=A0ACB7TKT1_HYAAI|nr:hypothetical protein HPB50_015408 [Hyalomma asiaticum]